MVLWLAVGVRHGNNKYGMAGFNIASLREI